MSRSSAGNPTSMPVTGSPKPTASNQFQPECQPMMPSTLRVRSTHAQANNANRNVPTDTNQ
jgi:hypothetical protein